MKKTKLRKGDEVAVLAGNDKGKTGKILSFRGDRVVVSGVNIRKKHSKPTQQDQKGRRIDIECGVHISNVKLFVQERAVKMRVRAHPSGEREIYYKEGGSDSSYRMIKKKK